MKIKLTLAWILLFAFTLAVYAQPPSQPPKPGPEQKKLGYFIGKWTSEGEAKPSPFGPGGKFTFTENNSWFAGRVFVVSNT